MHPPGSATARFTATDERAARSRRFDSVGVAAVGVVTADAADLSGLRTNPTLDSDGRILRHANEQTVLALTAVRRAAEAAHLGPFDDWSVIVAPRWQGRSGTTAFIERFHAVGVRGIGPHAIPNLSLHACAATVSLGLAARGAVFGAGGGPFHVTDGLLAALTVQLGRDTPGTWLAITEWDGDESAGFGRAVALSLVPVKDAGARWMLSMGCRSWAEPPASHDVAQSGHIVARSRAGLPRKSCHDVAALGHVVPTRLAGLAEFFSKPAGARWDCPFDGGEFSLTAGGEP